MADIVGSLFGVAPQAVQASIANPMFERAAAFAQMDPMQRAQFGLYSGGAMLGQGIGGLLGGEDPRLVQARQMQQVKDWISKNGVDINSPDGLSQAAQYAQSIGATEGAMVLGQQAQQVRRAASEEQLKTAQATRAEALAKREDANLARQDKLEQVMQELGPNASPKQIQQAIFPYLSSEEKVKLLTSKYAMGTGAATAGGDGSTMITGAKMGQKTPEGAPFVVGTDKVGRVKLSDGRVIPAAQFYAAQDANNQAQFALDAVLSIDENTVKQAFGSAADYTEIPYGGAIRPTTASAQTNIKNLKIKDTLEKLGPLKGATSDREFSTIMSSFPAFTASPKVMQEWLDRAEKYLRNRVKTGQKQFGVMETASPEEPKKTSSQVIKLD